MLPAAGTGHTYKTCRPAPDTAESGFSLWKRGPCLPEQSTPSWLRFQVVTCFGNYGVPPRCPLGSCAALGLQVPPFREASGGVQLSRADRAVP